MTTQVPARAQPEVAAAEAGDPSPCRAAGSIPRGYEVEASSTGQEFGQRWLLAPGRHRIGRDRQCQISLGCPSISRQHVELEVMETGGLVVVDLDSTNGTRINGRRVLRQAISGDFELSVGQQRLRFRELRRDGR